MYLILVTLYFVSFCIPWWWLSEKFKNVCIHILLTGCSADYMIKLLTERHADNMSTTDIITVGGINYQIAIRGNQQFRNGSLEVGGQISLMASFIMYGDRCEPRDQLWTDGQVSIPDSGFQYHVKMAVRPIRCPIQRTGTFCKRNRSSHYFTVWLSVSQFHS
jgi:hypothetical protein